MLLKLKKNRKGFTLIELIVVVAIIAILAAIAVPNFLAMQDRAMQGTIIGSATALAGAINVYNATDPETKIAAADAAAITTLDTLAPTFDSKIDMAKVYARISFEKGVAVVNSTIS